jgi:putative ABC transport system substrate-binding protein
MLGTSTGVKTKLNRNEKLDRRLLTQENQKMNEVIWIGSRSSVSLKSVLRNLKFAILLWTVVFALCHPTHAQQPGKIYRIGFLSGGFPGPSHWTTRLRKDLRDLGYIEGKNIVIESRFSENKIERLPALADELVRLKVEVIVAGGRNDTRAAKNATRTIPIVGLSLVDPVADGLVDSLARPGANLTGFTPIAGELAGKRLELLKEAVLKLSRVAVLWDPNAPTSDQTWKNIEGPASALGLQLHSAEVSSPDKFEAVFNDAIKARSGALSVNLSAMINANQRRVHQLAARHRLPAIYPRAEFVHSGGLMSYGADRAEGFKRVAVMVDKILKGTKPADIPVERPTKFEFIISLKAAKQIGLTIPPNVLARADRVIR